MQFPPCSPVAPALPLHVFEDPLRPCLPTAAWPHAQSCHLLSDSLQDLKAFAYSNWVKSNTSCKKLLRMLAALIASTRLGPSRARSFREDSTSLLTPGLVPPWSAPEHRIPGTGWRPGQPERHPTLRMSWGEDNPETDVVVPVVWRVPVTVGGAQVPRIIVRRTPAQHSHLRPHALS